MREWTKEEVAYLEKNYSINPNMQEMKKFLKRSRRAIQHKGKRLGLSRPRFPSNKPSKRTPKKIIDKKHYVKHKQKILKKRRNQRKNFRIDFKKMLGGKCAFCGYCRCFAALEFHHIKSDKASNISTLIKNDSEQKILKEIKKCILLCANCHREVHHNE